MAVQMGSQGQAGFDQPIELLMDCHRRIEQFLALLVTVVERYGEQRLDVEARKALETALHYFHEAAPRHTADEEESLFPRLRKVDDPQVQKVMTVLDRLESDHRAAELAHARVDEIGRQWLAEGALEPGKSIEIQQLLAELSATYARHIQLEDEEVFVLAANLLADDALQAVGREMKERRNDGGL